MRKTLIFIALISLSACAIKKVASERQFDSRSLSGEQLIDSVYKRNISEYDYFIEKAEIKIVTNENTERYLFTIKHQKPDKYLVSIRNTSGIEGVRIFITEDSIFVNDRINSRLMIGKRSFLERRIGIPGDFFKVAFGDLVYDKKRAGSKVEQINNQLNIISYRSDYAYKSQIDSYLGKVIACEIINLITGKRKSLTFGNFARKNMTVAQLITFEDEERNISAKVKISRIQIPWEGEINFIPGKGYAREEFK